ncbi:MAG: peptidase M50 [Mycobacterium sp.]
MAGLPVLPVGGPNDRAGVDAAIGKFARLVVVGDDAELALVLSRLLRAERLDVEVGYVARRRTPATGVYRLPTGRRAARRARYGTALPMPLIRDDTGTALVGVAHWLPAGDTRLLHGEGIVDDHALFDGDVAGVRIEPTPGVPGLRTAVRPGRGRMRRWVRGRAAQLGTTGARVVRDGVSGARTVKRSTFYRHVEGWLLVR